VILSSPTQFSHEVDRSFSAAVTCAPVDQQIASAVGEGAGGSQFRFANYLDSLDRVDVNKLTFDVVAASSRVALRNFSANAPTRA